MAEDLEKRVSHLERTSDRAADALERLSNDLHEIKSMMAKAMMLDTKVAAMELDSSQLWSEVETLKNRAQSRDTGYAVLQAEHDSCRPKVDTLSSCSSLFEHRMKEVEDKLDRAGKFMSGRAASLADKLIWVGLGGAAASFVTHAVK